MTETQERFLHTILARVPFDTIVELHLFPAIRRGTLETGVAVIAADLPAATLAVVSDELHEPFVVSDELQEPSVVIDEPQATSVVEDSPAAERADDTVLAATGDGESSPYRDETAGAETGTADSPDDAVAAPTATTTPAPRLRILTASYRHTIKGVERGKWSVDVQDEADAPLEAVEAVLRGVRQRSTEPADPEMVSRDTLAQFQVPSAVAPAA